MKLLLDTHVLLWWLLDDRRLVTRARSALLDRRNRIFVSAVSAWEVALKAARGKLPLPPGGEARIQQAVATAGFLELPITFEHAFELRGLPRHHADPFDRLLVAQCRIEQLTLVTNDRTLPHYGISCLW